LGKKAWNKMLAVPNLNEINSIADVGSNIGRNISFLKQILPIASYYAYDINHQALEILKETFPDVSTKCSSLLDLEENTDSKVDFVFTSQVLIHIDPKNLESAMRGIYSLSRRYILIAEYFNRTPTSIEYRGEKDVLFKRDFGGMFLDLFPAKCLDYGFLWGREYDLAGFDDVTYWLFERLD
jgi:pseudaminic acid biosynthesis-associated methylase